MPLHPPSDGSHQNKNQNNRKQLVLASVWRNWNPRALLVGMEKGAAAVENSVAFSQKIKHGITI